MNNFINTATQAQVRTPSARKVPDAVQLVPLLMAEISSPTKEYNNG